jgi:AI-2E family transporter
VESRPTRVVNLLPAVLIGLGAVVVWGAVVQLSNALLLILLAVIIAASLNPAVIWAHRVLRLPRAIAAGAILFFVVGGFGLLLWLLVPAVIDQISSLISSVPAIVAQVQTWLADASRQYPILKSASESLSSTDLTGQLRGLLSSVPSTLLGAVGATTGLLGGILNGALLLIVGFTVLVQPEPLLRGAISAVPPKLRDDVSRAMIRIGAQLGGDRDRPVDRLARGCSRRKHFPVRGDCGHHQRYPGHRRFFWIDPTGPLEPFAAPNRCLDRRYHRFWCAAIDRQRALASAPLESGQFASGLAAGWRADLLGPLRDSRRVPGRSISGDHQIRVRGTVPARHWRARHRGGGSRFGAWRRDCRTRIVRAVADLELQVKG